ncbi:MAG: regulatory protein RecX [bacterium]
MKSAQHRRTRNDPAAQSDLFTVDSAARDLRAALAKAYRLLGMRARSEKELRDALARAGYNDEVIARVLEECRQKRFVDDTDFARQFVQSRLRQRPTGRARLQLELQQKGLAAETVSAVLGEVFENAETTARLADQLAEKLRKRLAALPPQKARQRLVDHLRRRGFDWETIEQTKLWQELGANV